MRRVLVFLAVAVLAVPACTKADDSSGKDDGKKATTGPTAAPERPGQLESKLTVAVTDSGGQAKLTATYQFVNPDGGDQDTRLTLDGKEPADATGGPEEGDAVWTLPPDPEFHELVVKYTAVGEGETALAEGEIKASLRLQPEAGGAPMLRVETDAVARPEGSGKTGASVLYRIGPPEEPEPKSGFVLDDKEPDNISGSTSAGRATWKHMPAKSGLQEIYATFTYDLPGAAVPEVAVATRIPLV